MKNKEKDKQVIWVELVIDCLVIKYFWNHLSVKTIIKQDDTLDMECIFIALSSGRLGLYGVKLYLDAYSWLLHIYLNLLYASLHAHKYPQASSR